MKKASLLPKPSRLEGAPASSDVPLLGPGRAPPPPIRMVKLRSPA